MIFSCDKATLLNGINIASKALPSKSVNPVCEGILFSLKNSEVVLTTTDSSLTIQTKIAAEIEEGKVIAQGNAPLNEDGTFVRDRVKARLDALKAEIGSVIC